MHTFQIKFLATGLLAAATFIFIFSSNSAPRETQDRADRRKPPISPQGEDSGRTVATEPKREKPMAEGASLMPTPRRTPENSRSSVPDHPEPMVSATREETRESLNPKPGSEASPAIQLGANVQLPAALMAQGTWASNPSLANSPAAMAANEEIVNSFYRELSERLSEIPPTPNGESPAQPPASGLQTVDATLIVSEGPIIQDVRERANQRFRTLYGNEAYNRLMMNAAIESSLPE